MHHATGASVNYLTRTSTAALLAVSLGFHCVVALAESRGDQDFLIDNVVLIDGTGADRNSGGLRVRNGVIVELGDLQPLAGESRFDGMGQVLAPGFIDTHSHAGREIEEHRGALAAVSQGITTSIVGQDGGSPYPLAEFYRRISQNPVAINLASYSGHNTLRKKVMGNDYRRRASDAEVESMTELLEQDMLAGALGLSSGLEYEPGIHSNSEEVIALAKVAAEFNGRYISHVRSEDRWFEAALDEIIEIGRVTGLPVQISHFKLAMKSLWGRAPEILAKLDAARDEGIDITADIYPYEYWQSNIMVLVPSRDLEARSEFEFALVEISPPEGLWFVRFDPQPEYVGMKLTEIAELRELDPVTTLMQLAAESIALDGNELSSADNIIGTSMLESDIQALLRWPHTNVCTDASLVGLHPRTMGSYPRILGRYVREQNVLSLEEAVRRMTSLAAKNMGLRDRGVLRPGAAADLVLFDPDNMIDHATPTDPTALSTGIDTVWVNGQKVFENGAVTGRYPGVILKRSEPGLTGLRTHRSASPADG
jgi:N-acyl-D-amino-acid deacylase